MKQFPLKDDRPINSLEKYLKTVIAMVCDRFFVSSLCVVLVLATITSSCRNRKELIDEPLYEGPLLTMDSIYTKMSDSANVVLILKAARQNNFEGGDKEWPEGLYLENIGDKGKTISTFKADYVYFKAKENLYRAEGNVVVKSIENGDELNTEELFWDPSEKRFYTDRFVTIESAGEIHTGQGLESNQDFSSYKILKPQGTLLMEE